MIPDPCRGSDIPGFGQGSGKQPDNDEGAMSATSELRPTKRSKAEHPLNIRSLSIMRSVKSRQTRAVAGSSSLRRA